MNCQNHPEIPAAAYCRACGKPVCEQCRRDALGTVYCEEHVPATAVAGESEPPPAAAPPAPGYAPPPAGFTPPPTAFTPPPAGFGPPPPGFGPPPTGYGRADVSPALAFFLGLIPGVGAIYNGQYAKGLVHAIVWGVLMSMANSYSVQSSGTEPVFVMLVIAWWAYMALEAHHTAKRLQRGEPVDEYSSLLNLRGGPNRVPVAAIGLIVLGVLLLLHTLDLLNFEYVARYWPVLLIAAGIYMLWERFSGRNGEVRHER